MPRTTSLSSSGAASGAPPGAAPPPRYRSRLAACLALVRAGVPIPVAARRYDYDASNVAMEATIRGIRVTMSAGRRSYDYAEIASAYRAGEAIEKIARRLCANTRTVRYALAVQGVPRRTSRPPRQFDRCRSCGRPRDDSFKCRYCPACDRRRWRNGACPACGRALRRGNGGGWPQPVKPCPCARKRWGGRT